MLSCDLMLYATVIDSLIDSSLDVLLLAIGGVGPTAIRARHPTVIKRPRRVIDTVVAVGVRRVHTAATR